ncbi:hypothetical protein QAD02_017877 [Eretmocerus hayati]|uniref:Uncharacterized protein n=1 Tax=Eretmocerus hayati TaxID=131215 RepID=A0ACC2PF74_9HYME|nr:hypothetical protein QAD02_017877 [Eretmocerus hayati]
MERPVITVNEGKLQGTTLKSVLGVHYFAFKGIPFAQPPIGPLRFKGPQPPLKWSGIRDASKHAGDVCVQYESNGPQPYKIFGGEDCLYLNVYTNAMECNRPVMIFVHGGGFIEDTGNDSVYSHEYLVSKNIVLVTVNYRLGPMGFLSLGNEEAAGNQGLRDVLMALKWVNRNIEAFGGDPKNVTLFGNSAGSMITHIFTLIPATRGLIHKAILQSGNAINSKNLIHGKGITNGFRIASLLGFKSDDPIKVVEFLRSLPAEKLVELQTRIYSKQSSEGIDPYGPIYDAHYSKDPVIPAPLGQLLKNDAHIPVIIGHTKNESLLFLMGQYNDETYKYYDQNIESIVKNALPLKDPSVFPEIMKEIRSFYLKNKPINKDTVWNLINLLSDINMVNGTRKIVDLRNDHAHASTYVYTFSYMGNEPTIYQFDKGPQPLKGVAHADELSYMFYLTYMREEGEKYQNQYPREGTKDRLVMERLLQMWYNFAISGNPTPTLDGKIITTAWLPSRKETLHYLDIGEKLILRSDKDSETRALYEKISRNLIF